MPRSFRAIREILGDSTGAFVSDPVEFIITAGEAVDVSFSSEETTNGRTLLRTDEGVKFLDFIESDKFSVSLMEAARDREDVVDIEALVGNLKSLAGDWRKVIDPDDGSLVLDFD